MPGSPESGASSAKFLEELGAALSAQKDVDAELAKVIREHVLKDSQKADAVSAARKAIAELALARAKKAGA